MTKKRAFTLIELLVVIAIIGVIATISIIALQNARAKSRDAKRAGDMKQVQTALELFFNDNNRYPTAEEFALGSIFSTSTYGTSTYMQIIPSAPTPADGSCTPGQNTVYYQQTENGNSYTISFCLGNTTGTLTAGPKCLTPAGIVDVDCGDSGIAPCSLSTPGGSQCTYGGDIYNTITIGSQVWFKENLNIGTYIGSGNTINGYDGINGTNDDCFETSGSGWGWWSCQGTAGIQKYCYENDENNCLVYGGFYDWSETMGLPYYCNNTQYTCDGTTCTSPDYVDCNYPDPASTKIQGICPSGWHVPSDADWYALEYFLSDDPVNNCDASRSGEGCQSAGFKLKTDVWGDSSNNSSGFTALPTGYRSVDGLFYTINANTFFWLADNFSSMSLVSLNRYLSAGVSGVNRSSDVRPNGLSVRCLRN